MTICQGIQTKQVNPCAILGIACCLHAGMQAHSQKLLLGGSFGQNVDLFGKIVDLFYKSVDFFYKIEDIFNKIMAFSGPF